MLSLLSVSSVLPTQHYHCCLSVLYSLSSTVTAVCLSVLCCLPSTVNAVCHFCVYQALSLLSVLSMQYCLWVVTAQHCKCCMWVMCPPSTVNVVCAPYPALSFCLPSTVIGVCQFSAYPALWLLSVSSVLPAQHCHCCLSVAACPALSLLSVSCSLPSIVIALCLPSIDTDVYLSAWCLGQGSTLPNEGWSQTG